jgi:adenylylsulfate kinase-like enzyme
VFVDTPLEICEQRDTKGLYRKARAGEIPDFTGIDSAYQRPQNPEITLLTEHETAEDSAEKILQYLVKRGIVQA